VMMHAPQSPDAQPFLRDGSGRAATQRIEHGVTGLAQTRGLDGDGVEHEVLYIVFQFPRRAGERWPGAFCSHAAILVR